MSGYREFVLPINPPNPYHTYLHSLAPLLPGDKTVCYTKYILGVIGILEFTSATSNVTEWTYPSQLLTSTMTQSANLTRLERDKTSFWSVATDYHGALVRFEPKSGTFTRYTTQSPATPIIAPSDLKFDGTGMLWFVGGSSASLSTISRFDPATGKVTSWEIPMTAMLNVQSICPNKAGTKVWVSSVDANVGSTRQWLGVLDVASGSFACFAPSPYNGDSPRSISIRLWEHNEKSMVWFTAAMTGGAADATVPGIYRTDPSGDVFHKYETTPAAWPRHIALEPTGTVWVTDIAAASLVHCEQQACANVPFKKRTFRLSPTKQRLTPKSYKAKPAVSTAPPHNDTVSVIKHPCTNEYNAPSMHSPDDVQYLAGGSTAVLVFVNWGVNKIGVLTA